MSTTPDISSASDIQTEGWRRVTFSVGNKQIRVTAVVSNISFAARLLSDHSETTASRKEKELGFNFWQSQLPDDIKQKLGLDGSMDVLSLAFHASVDATRFGAIDHPTTGLVALTSNCQTSITDRLADARCAF